MSNMNGMKLMALSTVLNDGQHLECTGLDLLSRQKYGCGFFHFTKLT